MMGHTVIYVDISGVEHPALVLEEVTPNVLNLTVCSVVNERVTWDYYASITKKESFVAGESPYPHTWHPLEELS